MELPQSRPFGTEGRKPTHDFLSLYSPVQQDPRPSPSPSPSPQGAYLETHDFLQPLDQVGKSIAKEGNKIEVTSIEKPPPPAPPPSVERTLPGGIGTYSISHVSFINQSQRVPKPEGVMFTVAQSSSSDRNDENSNCSSYTASGFTLWEEPAMKKGKTGKENIAGDRQVMREAGMRMGGGQWTASLERPSLSSSNHNHRSTISSLSSSQPSSAPKNQSFVDMIKSARSAQEDDEDDEEEFVIKKETSPNHKANLSVKVNAKGNDQKPNTPRSKHSATEQRRRSKINDRFSMLRELIPHSDQKRDKASFLLEVIEYIQYLQEKVHKHEDSYQGWNNGPTKLIPWGNSQRPTEGFIDQPRGSTSGPPPVYAKFDEHTTCIPPTIPRNGQNLVESNMSSADTIKELDHSRLTNKASPFPAALQSNIFSPGGSSNAAAPLSPRLASGNDNGASQPQSQLWNSRSCLTDCSDKLKEQELTIDSGTISVSTVYSQGLLNTLTHALQNSGVDLSQASISVQIDLGKRANSSTKNSSTSMHKINDAPSSNQALVRSRITSSTGEDCDVQALKRFKTGIS